tara:strand:+ start:1005 stop:1367 length:363 start_codon:yes stop_codon:yes gene_type:complete
LKSLLVNLEEASRVKDPGVAEVARDMRRGALGTPGEESDPGEESNLVEEARIMGGGEATLLTGAQDHIEEGARNSTIVEVGRILEDVGEGEKSRPQARGLWYEIRKYDRGTSWFYRPSFR